MSKAGPRRRRLDAAERENIGYAAFLGRRTYEHGETPL